MASGLLDLIQAIVLHAPLCDRLDHTELCFPSTSRATEGLGAGIDIVQAAELQACVTSADIAAEPHLSIGLGESAKSEGAMRPRSDHEARLEPAGGQ